MTVKRFQAICKSYCDTVRSITESVDVTEQLVRKVGKVVLRPGLVIVAIKVTPSALQKLPELLPW